MHLIYFPFHFSFWGCAALITSGAHSACCAFPVHPLPDHRRLVPLRQMLRAPTRRRVGVRRRAATARVTWPACTPTTGACPAVRTKTGCLLKVSAFAGERRGWILSHPFPPLCCFHGVGMFPVLAVVSGIIVRAVDLPVVSGLPWYSSAAWMCSAGSQLHFCRDLLHVPMVLLDDCLPNVLWWWGGKCGWASVLSCSSFLLPFSPLSQSTVYILGLTYYDLCVGFTIINLQRTTTSPWVSSSCHLEEDSDFRADLGLLLL